MGMTTTILRHQVAASNWSSNGVVVRAYPGHCPLAAQGELQDRHNQQD
jgi:hypothetical protein